MSHTRYIKDELEPLLTDLASCFANQPNDNPAMSVRTTEMIRQAYVTICAYRLELESSSSLLCQQQLAADQIVEECAKKIEIVAIHACECSVCREIAASVRDIRALKGKFLLSAQPNGGLTGQQVEALLTMLSNAAALFVLDYNIAKSSGDYLDHGIDSVLRPILNLALSEPRTAEGRKG
jgi:hypothetical protein